MFQYLIAYSSNEYIINWTKTNIMKAVWVDVIPLYSMYTFMQYAKYFVFL